MSHLSEGARTFIKDKELYGQKVRTFLGLTDSAVVVADDGSVLGYAGDVAKTELVNPTTATNGWGIAESVPLDFRLRGIELLSLLNIPEATQINMFGHFMTDFTKEQRSAYIAQFEALDPNDAYAVEAFVTNMVSLLNV